MSRLPFGTAVNLSAVVEPRYLSWRTTRTVYDPPDLGKFALGREEPVDPPELRVASHGKDATDIGDPLDSTEEIPRGGVHRRLRRFPDEAQGLVVGWVWRAEGQYHDARVSSRFGEYDEEPPHLAETRRVRLYQVAVDPGEVGEQFYPARIVLAHPDDVNDLG